VAGARGARLNAQAELGERFRLAIAERLGLHFDEGRAEFLAKVLARRAEATGASREAYLARLERDAGDEIGPLAQALTTPETYFFRHSDQFRVLTEVALPARIRARAAERRLRLLSAGCASGEEAWSIAMACQDLVDSSWDVRVLGVDANPAMIERARAARYTTWSLRETPPEAKDRWFRTDGREVTLSTPPRAKVVFEQRNLAADQPDLWRPGQYDVVFCRNVLMYLTPECAQRVVARIASSLAPGGILFLGHAETLRGLSREFHLRQSHGAFYYQARQEGEADTSPLPPPSAGWQEPPLVDTSGDWFEAIQRASTRIAALAELPTPTPGPSPARSRTRPDLAAARESMRLERYAEALQAIDESATDRDAMLLRAVLLVHVGRLREAEATGRRLLQLDELHAGAHYVLALCREAQGDTAGANEHNGYAAYLDPSFAMPRLHLGLLARRAGHRAAARKELKEAMDLLAREDPSRILLFGGGFSRDALVALCRSELKATGSAS
jgi:chemotaxis protein methyltransferase CheR